MCGKNATSIDRVQTIPGITPACAGKTYEHGIDEHLWVGSPPRVREKRIAQIEGVLGSGITPACAGKTLKDPNEIKTFLSF